MYLDTTSKILQVVLANAKTTNDCEIAADYIDTQAGSSFSPGNSLVYSNGTSAVSAVGSPAASTQRKISAFTFYNADTVNTTVTVRIYDGTNTWRIRVATLVPGQSLIYAPEQGWSVMQSTIGQIPGTQTNDNAAAGNVGEYIFSDVALSSAVSLSNNTVANLVTIGLTPGDWDVTFEALFAPGLTTTVNSIESSTSLVSTTLDLTIGRFAGFPFNGTTINILPSLSIASRRFSVSSNTTIYGVVNAAFGISTMSSFGNLSARRIR